MKCDRCGEEVFALQMSRFNTEMCCVHCLEIERKRPKYKEAVEAELQQVRLGNYNFSGVGRPIDL